MCFNTLWIYTALKQKPNKKTQFFVSIPSEFTLLSNTTSMVKTVRMFQYPLNLHCSQTGFFFEWYVFEFQYPLNLHCSQTVPFSEPLPSRFNTLWIYTALKHITALWARFEVSIPSEFTLLSNTMDLSDRPTQFQYPLNLHCSQTEWFMIFDVLQFQYPLNLHCSQTKTYAKWYSDLFQYPLNLHCSQT